MAKKKILLLSDDLRMASGIATMSKELVLGTAHKYDWFQVGAAINHPEAGKILDVNEASIKVTGVPRGKLINTNFSDYFTDPKKAQEGYLQVFKKGFVSDYPLTIKHKNGKLTDVLYNASVYKDDKGNVLGVFAAARDVTAQKLLSKYSLSLIEASLDPLVTINAILTVSPVAKVLFSVVEEFPRTFNVQFPVALEV